MPITKHCIRCNASFTVVPSRANQRFCSYACASAYQVGENSVRWKGGGVECICRVCGEVFRVKPSHVALGEGKTCSKQCAAKWQSVSRVGAGRKRTTKKCLTCGKSIEIKVSHEPIAGRYCSRACMALSYQSRMQGKNNPHWKDGKTAISGYSTPYGRIRRARLRAVGGSYTAAEWKSLKQTYNYTCLRCGRREPDICLTVDHVIPITMGGRNSIDNIQPLCFSCNCAKGPRIADYRDRTYAVAVQLNMWGTL